MKNRKALLSLGGVLLVVAVWFPISQIPAVKKIIRCPDPNFQFVSSNDNYICGITIPANTLLSFDREGGKSYYLSEEESNYIFTQGKNPKTKTIDIKESWEKGVDPMTFSVIRIQDDQKNSNLYQILNSSKISFILMTKQKNGISLSIVDQNDAFSTNAYDSYPKVSGGKTPEIRVIPLL